MDRHEERRMYRAKTEALLHKLVLVEKMFREYVDIILKSEGHDFLYEWEWTPEEWGILIELGIANENRAIHDPPHRD